MNSIPNPKQTNPHDVAVAALKEAYEQFGRADEELARVDELVSKLEQDAAPHPSDPQQAYEQFGRADEELARVDEEVAKLEQDAVPHPSDPQQAYEQFGRADEQLARVDEQVSKLEQDAVPHPSDPQTRINTFQPFVPGDRPLLGGQPVRAFIGLILAACIGVAAVAWQSPSYRDAARQIIASWAPQLVPILSLIENPGLPAHPSPATIQAGTANTAPLEPAPVAQTAPGVAAPAAAALSPELTQLLQSTARDLATVGHEIEQLKTSQEQMVRANAELAEQLRAAQAQMARPIAKASEQNLRPKTSAPPARPIATPTRKLVPKPSSPQATAQPQAEPVSRPLTPLR